MKIFKEVKVMPSTPVSGYRLEYTHGIFAVLLNDERICILILHPLGLCVVGQAEDVEQFISDIIKPPTTKEDILTNDKGFAGTSIYYFKDRENPFKGTYLDQIPGSEEIPDLDDVQ